MFKNLIVVFDSKDSHNKVLKPKSFQTNQVPAIQRGINLRALQSNAELLKKKAQRMNFGKGRQIVQNVSCDISIKKRY